MTWRRQSAATASAMLASLILVAFASGAGVEVRGEKMLFPVEENRAFGARLTPGGKQLLYHRSADGGPKRDQLIVRDLQTGNERVLDVGPAGDAGTLFYYHPFDAHGRVVALPDYRKADAKFAGDLKRPVQVVELGTGRVARTRIVADLRYARLDPTGEMLIGPGPRVTRLANNTVRHLRAPGFVDSVNPVAPIASFMKSKSEGGPGLVLWDYANDRMLADLPVDRENTRLDDYLPRWTSDGHYLYYIDVDPTKDGHEEQLQSRVWDARAGKLVTTVPRLGPVGPGPSPTTMVLRPNAVSGLKGFVVHDLATGMVHPIHIEDSEEFASAWDGKIVYVKRVEGTRHLCVADLVMPMDAGQTPQR